MGKLTVFVDFIAWISDESSPVSSADEESR